MQTFQIVGIAVGLTGGLFFAVAMALALGGVGRSYIRLRMDEALEVDRQQLHWAQVALWKQLNWWRYPPSEGWRIGFNIDRLPMDYHLHVEQHGRIIAPTDAEIRKDINSWHYLGGLHVRLPDGTTHRLR